MPAYQLFGGVFQAPFEIPGLQAARGGVPDWALTVAAPSTSTGEVEVLGTEQVEPGVEVALQRCPGAWRLVFDDTGPFDISEDGSTITWRAPTGADLDAARKDLLGRVLPLCLHLRGVVSLHGSAVALRGEAIAFVAPKFHGKSTTAAALVEAGALLLADDVIPVRDTEVPVVLPSVGFLQLWKDAAEQVATGAEAVPGAADGPKAQRRWARQEARSVEATPLSAVYLLAPAGEDANAVVSRARIPPVQAALALLGQLKLANLLGPAERGRLLDVTARLAERVAVYRLTVPKGLDRIHELTNALQAWHAPPPPTGPAP